MEPSPPAYTMFRKTLFAASRRALTKQKTNYRHHIHHASTFAVAFDIDGVLYRGSQDISPAKSVIETLQRHNIPVLFLTNGGGTTETNKVQHLGQRLNISNFIPEQMFQSHTPMKHLNEYKDQLVLAVGKDQAKHILET